MKLSKRQVVALCVGVVLLLFVFLVPPTVRSDGSGGVEHGHALVFRLNGWDVDVERVVVQCLIVVLATAIGVSLLRGAKAEP